MENATDIGYLFHKNPANLHQTSLAFGDSYVFYPITEPQKCSMSFLVDVDPITLIRGRKGDASDAYPLQHYVNHYTWPFDSLDDIKVAPFHILATEGQAHYNRDHIWHMESITKISKSSEIIIPTPYRVVTLDDENSVKEACDWWEEITKEGREGMVIKPLDFTLTRKGRVIQPAIKCRGRDYLRIIYGPEYTAVKHMQRLKSRNLSKKRAMAIREYSLGIEALERFIANQPLRKVHECVFGVMAMESEPVDPML
jgi:protein phosphatase